MTYVSSSLMGRRRILIIIVALACTLLTAVVIWLRPTVKVTRTVTLVRADVRVPDAVEHGDLVTLRAIIDADPRLVNGFREGGMTLLHLAAQAGQTEVVRLLLERGASVAATVEGDWGNRGETPLFAAVGSGNMETIAVLVERGADVNVRNRYGNTPAGIARVEGHEDIARFLESHASRGVSGSPPR